MIRAGFFNAAIFASAFFLLSGCVTPGLFPTRGSASVDAAANKGSTEVSTGVIATHTNNAATTTALREPVRVAILVPQTGQGAAYGEALLQAAQLAVFDVNEPQFQLIPKDTKGTAEGARRAVDEAAREGAKLILGPLFAQEVSAARTAARMYGLTVIGFSTDWRVAGDNTFTMGVLPFGQVERIADYAARQGLRRIAVVATKDMYGDAVLSLFQSSAQRLGMGVVKVVRIAADGSDATTALRELTAGYDPANGQTYDGLFIPVGGKTMHVIASTLRPFGLGSDNIRYLGTGLWDDADMLSDPNMGGAAYAAPSPQVRAAFERNYQRIYGKTPPRLASIGYDSAALAIVLARNASINNARVAFDRNSLLNANGFSGVDGIFRFRSNGLVERGMAILQIAGGSVHMAEPAPTSFQGQ